MVSVGRQSTSPACTPLYFRKVAVTTSLSGFQPSAVTPCRRAAPSHFRAVAGSSLPAFTSPTTSTSRCLHGDPRDTTQVIRFCVQHEYRPSAASRQAYTRCSDDWLRTTPVTWSVCTSAYNWNFSDRSIDTALASFAGSVAAGTWSRKPYQSVGGGGSRSQPHS